jgi:predicted oxidoreductase
MAKHPQTAPRIALKDGGGTLSPLAAGCMRLVQKSKGEKRAVDRFIDAALALDITSFDLADIYGGQQAEALFGRALKDRPELRGRIELVSKCGVMPVADNLPGNRVLHIDLSAEHIVASVERSLRALNAERIDVYLLHRPDPLLRADEVAAALAHLRASGKVRAFGVSNFSAGQFAHLQSRLDFPLVTNQIELSLLNTSALRDGTLDQLRERGLAIMAWSPLAGGKLLDPNHHAAAALRPILARIGAQYRVEPAAVALAWLRCLADGMLPVLGSIDAERLRQAGACRGIALDRQEWYELYAAAGNRFA